MKKLERETREKEEREDVEKHYLDEISRGSQEI
jgi:hypothetical protein